MSLRPGDASPRKHGQRSREKKEYSYRLGDCGSCRGTRAAASGLAEVFAPDVVVADITEPGRRFVWNRPLSTSLPLANSNGPSIKGWIESDRFFG